MRLEGFPSLIRPCGPECRFPGSDRVYGVAVVLRGTREGRRRRADEQMPLDVAVVAAAHGALGRDVVTDHC